MPRANRSFLPGHIWHITHRCHKKEFLLKFRKDKLLWLHWALQAKIRYGLVILNFMITSNHIHLLAIGRALRSRMQTHHAISTALQLIESRVAQEFNSRKDRHGAFWEDRYHGTAIESGPQLARCLTYIDMNMVRAGVVGHPREWPYCGFSELAREVAQSPTRLRRRSLLVDTDALMELTGAPDPLAMYAQRCEWIDLAIRKGRLERDPVWTESLAVGSDDYLRSFAAGLGNRIGSTEIVTGDVSNDVTALRRTRGNPIIVFGLKNAELRPFRAQNGDLNY
jgi:putative transposase